MIDAFAGMARAQAARACGNKGKVFDWDQAARLIVERKPSHVEASLQGDYSWTGGTIYANGKPVTDSYTYLMSLWATPVIHLDGEEIPCFVDLNTTECDWESDTKWPPSALAILQEDTRPC